MARIYAVPFAYEMYGRIEVEASSEEEARKKAEEELVYMSTEDMAERSSYLEDSLEIDEEGEILDRGEVDGIPESEVELTLTAKQEAIRKDLADDTSGFGNGHTFYMIAGLKENEVGPALEKIKEVEGKNALIFCELTIENSQAKGEYVINIHCHEKYQTDAITDISKAFPYAVCYWNDAWDYPDYIEAFKNGEEVRLPDVCKMAIDEDFEDEENDWYECTAVVTDKASNASFYIGGGGISKDQYDNIWSMIFAV